MPRYKVKERGHRPSNSLALHGFFLLKTTCVRIGMGRFHSMTLGSPLSATNILSSCGDVIKISHVIKVIL